jgi:hypothetical protein
MITANALPFPVPPAMTRIRPKELTNRCNRRYKADSKSTKELFGPVPTRPIRGRVADAPQLID